MNALGLLLGIDLGTSSAKALLVSLEGVVVGSGSAEYSIRRPQSDWAEQDPSEWWRAVVGATQQALNASRVRPQEIIALGISGQMHGTVLLDERYTPIVPAIIWPDQRAYEQVVRITAEIGARRLISITGSPLAIGFQAATVCWVRQKWPEIWARVRRVLLPKDYLRFRLTGEFATDPSDGSGTLLLDVHRRDWSDELLAAVGMDKALLPPVKSSSEVAGELKPTVAAELGLRAGLPVAVGAADTACSMLGAGVVDERDLLLTISSGGQIVLPAHRVRVDYRGRIHTFCSALEPEARSAGWYQMAATLAAGLSLRWLRDQVLGAPGTTYDEMIAWAEDVPAGARGLLFLPYLSGERTPHMDPQARGVLLGLGLHHGRAELVRAVLEGVVLGCWDAYRVLAELGATPGSIVMAGGGARARLWQQIVADVFALPVWPLERADQSAIGAAILAGASIGAFEAADVAKVWAVYGPAVEPDERHHALYMELYPLFRDLYRRHRRDFVFLAQLVAGERES